jgi:type VI secretion system protein ImpM
VQPLVGFFGKLPSHGDFLERQTPGVFRDVWDSWLAGCIEISRRSLGERWLDCYLTSPFWRFYLSDGVAGSAAYGGVLLPSVDRVGRYFPLTVMVELPANLAAIDFADGAADWFEAVESLCLGALEDSALDLPGFEQSLKASAARLDHLDALAAPTTFPGRSAQWRWPVTSTRALSAALGGPLLSAAYTSLKPLTMWWTDGSNLIHPSVLLVRGLPSAESFESMLAGGWHQGHWDGILSDEIAPAANDPGELGGGPLATPIYTASSAGVTDKGPIRAQNQDNLIMRDDRRLWAVADGMGGMSHGEIASQMVVDALSDVPSWSSLSAGLDTVGAALSRVNTDLRRAVRGESDRSGAVVVVLLMDEADWAVAWAGDSRAYLYRSGTLSRLTHDHTVAAEMAALSGVLPPWATTGEVTRAVGGTDTLELERASDKLAPGDRFLLCSDGLYGALGEAEIATYLELGDAQTVSRALLEAACRLGATDNVTALIVDVIAAV